MSLITSLSSSAGSVIQSVLNACLSSLSTTNPEALLNSRKVTLEQPGEQDLSSSTSLQKTKVDELQKKIKPKRLKSSSPDEATLAKKKPAYNKVLFEKQALRRSERIQNLSLGKTHQPTELPAIQKRKKDVANNEGKQKELKNSSLSNTTSSKILKSPSEENGKKPSVVAPKIETLENLVRELPKPLQEISISYLGPDELQEYERELRNSIIELVKNNQQLSPEMEKNALGITTLDINGQSHDLSEDQNINLINYCKNIKFLSMCIHCVTSTVMEAIAKLKNLYFLDISQSRGIQYYSDFYTNSQDLTHISELLSLRKLKLPSCINITINNGLVHLAKLINLYELDLSECYLLKDNNLAVLPNFLNLQNLNLGLCTEITNNGLAYLSQLVELRCLNLSNCQKITGEGFNHLTKLQNLEELNLHGCRNIARFVDLDPLAQLRNLKKLKLSDCDITDDDLKIIAQLENLEELDLSECRQITDDGANEIAKLRNLKKLNLSCCEGIKKYAFSQLVILENLEEIRVGFRDMRTSTHGLDKLYLKKLKKW